MPGFKMQCLYGWLEIALLIYQWLSPLEKFWTVKTVFKNNFPSLFNNYMSTKTFSKDEKSIGPDTNFQFLFGIFPLEE